MFVALNFVFALLGAAIGGTIDTFFSEITEQPLGILTLLFGSVVLLPGLAIYGLVFETILVGAFSDIGLLLTVIGYVASPLISSLVAGKMAETKGEAFGAWLVAMLISGGALVAAYFLDISVGAGTYLTIGGGDMGMIIFILVSAAINGVFYASFAQLMSGMDYY
ncbi:MAG: hypothetical protein ACOC44_00250 [Promethearchaeia archaeon]